MTLAYVTFETRISDVVTKFWNLIIFSNLIFFKFPALQQQFFFFFLQIAAIRADVQKLRGAVQELTDEIQVLKFHLLWFEILVLVFIMLHQN